MTEAEMMERIHLLGAILALTDDECAKVLEDLKAKGGEQIDRS